jgi:hypothetical protein
VTFTLSGNGAQFPGAGVGGVPANVLQLTGLRMSVIVQGAGLPAWQQAVIKIYGMKLVDMSALAVQTMILGRTGYLPNTVLVEANSGTGWTAAYTGNIYTAAPDFTAAPDVPLVVTSVFGGYDQLNPSAPSSFPGSTSIDTIMSVLIAKTGQAYVNAGVTGVTSGATYFPFAPLENVRKACNDFNLDVVPDNTNAVMVVTPKGQADKSTPFTLSPSSGLVGYPVPQANGMILVRSLYNPAFHIKSPITITGSDAVTLANNAPETYNSGANGNWCVSAITNTLESLTPNGAWFSDMLLYPPEVVDLAPST